MGGRRWTTPPSLRRRSAWWRQLKSSTPPATTSRLTRTTTRSPRRRGRETRRGKWTPARMTRKRGWNSEEEEERYFIHANFTVCFLDGFLEIFAFTLTVVIFD